MDLNSHLSVVAQHRGTSRLRDIVVRFHGREGVVGMHGGLPPASAFPLTGLELQLADGSTSTVDGDLATAAQQYNISPTGYPPLVAWLKRHMASEHPGAPPTDLLMSCGATHAIAVCLETFLNPGDALVIEAHTYSHLLEGTLWAHRYPLLPVEMDAHGMLPDSLTAVLEAFRRDHPDASPPRVMYTVPNGQNPTGATMGRERMRQIYDIAAAHDLIIIEDDPYYYLTFPDAEVERHSYLRMDVDGRVVRLDSFAKCMAPGLRLGWISARPDVAAALTLALQAVTMGPCSLSQVACAQLLSGWGEAGFRGFVTRVAQGYAARCGALCDALSRECPEAVSFTRPACGMFLWLRMAGEDPEVWAATLREMEAAGVIVVPGYVFNCRGNEPGFRSPYFRLSFSSATEEQLRDGAQRLGRATRAALAASQKPALAGGVAE